MRGAGVRARQEKVVFCTCEDETLVNDSVRPLVGSIVQLRVSGGAVSIEAYDAANNDVGAADAAVPASNGRGTGSPLRVQPAAIKRVSSASWLAAVTEKGAALLMAAPCHRR